jgi:uncharacterized protein involved in type VI secretion and phage assembly
MTDSPFERILDSIQELAGTNQVHGIRYAEVDRIEDDGYVLTWLSSDDDAPSAPARMATLMAGNERGTFFNPEPGDEVVVAFEAGDLDRPVIIGSLWSDVDSPPADADTSSSNNLRIIRSRLGHQLTFDDTPGAGKVTLQSAGEHKLEMDDAARKLTIQTPGDLKIEMDATAQKITIVLNASTSIELSTAGIDIKGAMINLN